MAILSRPVVFVEIQLARFPASLGTQVVRLTRAARPRSLAGAFYHPRIKSFGTIVRAATDPDGNYAVGGGTMVLDDEDGYLREMLDEGTNTEYWLAREIGVWAISEEGLAAGLTPATAKPVARGWISDVQDSGHREVTVRWSDPLGSQMSASNIDKKALRHQFKSIATTPLEATQDEWLPVYVGEFSDKGATDAAGANAERGVLPARELCEIDITNITGVPAPTYAAPPVITGSSVVGATGQETLYYGATLITPYGESAMSNIVSCDGASQANRNLSNYNKIDISFDYGDPANPNKVRIWVGPSATMVGWLDEADYGAAGLAGYLDGAKSWSTPTRDELDYIKYMAPPAPSAQTNTNIFSFMAICEGYDYDILQIFGSDLANGVEPRRIEVPLAEYGVTVIRPTDPQWPFPNAWLEMNGVQVTGFLMRGPILNHHRDGTITMAVNMCGPGDLNQAFYQWQFLLNEYCLKNKGSGRTTETYGTLETYANGDPLLQTSAFQACQELSMDFLGDSVGYQGQLFIIDPEDTWRDVGRRFFGSFACKGATNRYGQQLPILINTIDDGVLGRHFREKIEIKRNEQPFLAHDEVINRFLLNYFYDIDAGAYRGVEIPFSNLDSIAAHIPGGVSGGADLRGLKERTFDAIYTAHATTAYDAVSRELIRRQRRPRYPVITVGMLGLDHDLGGRARLTDRRGLGVGGDVATSMVILRHELSLDAEEVTLTLQDRTSITTGTNPAIGSNALSTSFAVGSNAAAPPTSRMVG